jgi:hypothetical protein
VANIEKEFKALWLKTSTSTFFSLKFVTHHPEWRLVRWGEDEKKQYNIYIFEENINRGKYGRNIKKYSALTETFPFDNVSCVVQWPLREFLRGLHGNRSSGTQEIQHRDQVACSQSKTIELNNSHLPHRKEKSCSHF